jgi:hypothetical protein
MSAQAQRAEDAVEATETAQKAVAEYVDNTFPVKVEDANKTIAKAVTDGTSVITQTANQAIGAISSHTSTIVTALNQKQTQIEASIDTKAQAVNSALDNKITEANTAIDGKVTEANDAKADAVKAKGEAETAKGQAEKSAKSASESAEQASTSAQQAEDAKDAIGDVSGRLDALETLDGVFEKRDILAELQNAINWEEGYYIQVAIRNVVTTANGNIVVYAQISNTKNGIYVLDKEGVILAEQKSAHAMTADYEQIQWLVQSGDAVYFLTKTVCYKITDTETSAKIESIGNLDFNGLATNLPYFSPTGILEIEGKVILSNLVIDLATLKVVQVLASGIVATHKSNGCYATLANGTVTQLTVSADGLIKQADFVDSNGNAVQKNARVIEEPAGEMFCFAMPSTTALTTLFVGRRTDNIQYGKSVIQPMKSVISRGNKLVSIATNGNLLMNSAKRRGDATGGVRFNSIAMQMGDEPLLIGVDNGGVWVMGARTSVWAGSHPTSALVRVNF